MVLYYYNLMVQPSYMRYIVDQRFVLLPITVCIFINTYLVDTYSPSISVQKSE